MLCRRPKIILGALFTIVTLTLFFFTSLVGAQTDANAPSPEGPPSVIEPEIQPAPALPTPTSPAPDATQPTPTPSATPEPATASPPAGSPPSASAPFPTTLPPTTPVPAPPPSSAPSADSTTPSPQEMAPQPTQIPAPTTEPAPASIPETTTAPAQQPSMQPSAVDSISATAEIKYFDAGLGQDAGDQISSPLSIGVGNFEENWLQTEEDKDAYQFPVKGGEIYNIVLNPRSMSYKIRATLFDSQGLQVAVASAPHGGAGVTLGPLTAVADGVFSLLVENDEPAPYKYSLQISQGPPPDLPTPEVPTPQEIPSTEIVLDTPSPVVSPDVEEAEHVVEQAKKSARKVKTTLMTYLIIGVIFVVLFLSGVAVLIFMMVNKKKT